MRLRSYLARSCNDWSLADDLMQDAYYRFLRSGFASDDERHCKNYLYRIATNLLRDHFRRRRRVGERTVELDGGAELPAPPAAPPDLELDLGPLLARLKPRDRQLLWLAHVEGQSHEEVAATLGIRTASVRSMLFRARGRLAALLAERGLDRGVLS
jgi:RNA polymerase sigma-70 factor (ECF subfamily)